MLQGELSEVLPPAANALAVTSRRTGYSTRLKTPVRECGSRLVVASNEGIRPCGDGLAFWG